VGGRTGEPFSFGSAFRNGTITHPGREGGSEQAVVSGEVGPRLRHDDDEPHDELCEANRKAVAKSCWARLSRSLRRRASVCESRSVVWFVALVLGSARGWSLHLEAVAGCKTIASEAAQNSVVAVGNCVAGATRVPLAPAAEGH
jgi:hypothetical protein